MLLIRFATPVEAEALGAMVREAAGDPGQRSSARLGAALSTKVKASRSPQASGRHIAATASFARAAR
jgi:hypothetical protein